MSSCFILYLTFNTVILIILETLDKKEEIMRKVLLLLAVLLIVLPLSARSKLEFAPRGTVYIGAGPNDDFYFGIGADFIVNPKKQFGLRVNMGEILFGNETVFSLNMINMLTPINFDLLWYTNIAGLFSYVDMTFGLLSSGGNTAVVFGGGLGLEKYMGKGNYIFLEPDLLFSTDGASDLIFRISAGMKLGI
jgi:hypothetical protein